jgi:hypothetical protein
LCFSFALGDNLSCKGSDFFIFISTIALLDNRNLDITQKKSNFTTPLRISRLLAKPIAQNNNNKTKAKLDEENSHFRRSFSTGDDIVCARGLIL